MMLREVGKTYARAFQMMFQHPLFLRISVGCYLVDFFMRIALDSAKKNLPGLNLFWSFIGVIESLLLLGVPMIFILIVFQVESGFDIKEIFKKARLNFWKFVGQSIVGLFLTLIFSFPFFCFLIFSINSKSAFLVFILWELVLFFLSMGLISLGQRFVLDVGEGLLRSSIAGFRMMRENLNFFVVLFAVNSMITLAYMAARISISSMSTGTDLYSMATTQFLAFFPAYAASANMLGVSIFGTVYCIVFTPLLDIVYTLAYLRCKSRDSEH